MIASKVFSKTTVNFYDIHCVMSQKIIIFKLPELCKWSKISNIKMREFRKKFRLIINYSYLRVNQLHDISTVLFLFSN